MQLTKKYKNNILRIILLCLYSNLLMAQNQYPAILNYSTVVCGSQQFGSYLPLLKNKRVAVLTNNTGLVNNTSIVDTLLKLQVKIVKIFGPEHGFRGNTEAGQRVSHNKDPKTKLPVISLYGKNKKPNKEQLKDVDVLVYDIQDLGVRFYTYISTLTYAMEACAENNKQLLVLDRPNPNGFYIDGPVLQKEWKSFLGLHEVPIVYGMTCGEYSRMVNGEGWLKNGIKCQLTVIPMQQYNRKVSYLLPVKPSPNIPNSTAVLLYPGLGLLEGTIISLGRGTDWPFQVIGHPSYSDSTFVFVPKPSAISKEPKYVNQSCRGLDLRQNPYVTQHPGKINLQWLIQLYSGLERIDFFDENFNYHAGNAELKEQIKNHMREEDIRASWQEAINQFKQIRKKYLLYPDVD